MPGMNGIEVIAKARELRPEIEAVVMTGKPSQETAIAALRYQVFEYLTKPCRLSRHRRTCSVASPNDAKPNVNSLRWSIGCVKPKAIHNWSATRRRWTTVKKLISKVAPTDSTVLIRGETGCGKELVARAVHEASLRADKPLVAVNCGALPENLIESELFGHCRGAFTGADSARTGLFEVANGGTIFLDEIGELPLSMQAKLLRVLETGDIRRLGDNQTVHVDVRIVCATHRDLEEMVEEGTLSRRPDVSHQHLRDRSAAAA